MLTFPLVNSCALQKSTKGTISVSSEGNELYEQVIVQRTDYGVPHISADNFKAAGYALGYVQMEDYGKRVINGLIRARGGWTKFHDKTGKYFSREIDKDVINKRNYNRAVETWSFLDKDTRDIMKGFAKGINQYIERNPDEFDNWVEPFFTGYDVHAKGVKGPSKKSIKQFIKANEKKKDVSVEQPFSQVHQNPDKFKSNTLWKSFAYDYKQPNPSAGSNVWALAPSRTKSGNAILLRNPHLSWNAGYYEAHLKVSDKLNFYGDFRIGAPLGIIGGFNEHLGFSTTNNYPKFLDEIYALKRDSKNENHYLLDGISHPIQVDSIVVEYKDGDKLKQKSRKILTTPFGPVISRDNDKIYIIHSVDDGEFRTGEQFFRMMKARKLAEWKDAMRMQAKSTSNLTYADREGNIFYVWNATIPDLPHPRKGDTTATLVAKSEEIWRNLIPWDSLPQLKNPKGGYLHNENDPFHYTNLNEVFDASNYSTEIFPEPKFDLRSQKAYELIHDMHQKFSLEDVVDLQYDEGMLLADRVKGDLVKAVKRNNTLEGREVRKAIRLIEQWDNTSERKSRGGVLFKNWWDRYVKTADTTKVKSSAESVGFFATPEKIFEKTWSPDQPTETPSGLADPDRAVKAFDWAVKDTEQAYGSWAVPWGEVHRAMVDNINKPAGGCPGAYGCFRTMWFNKTKKDGKGLRKVRGGDGWILAVEFDEIPRAFSVLPYGQSAQKDAPFYYDQLDLFLDKKMKPVPYTIKDIDNACIKEYRPGANGGND